MNESLKSGLKLRKRVYSTHQNDELQQSNLKHRISATSFDNLIDKQSINAMANQTYQRILKSKTNLSKIQTQHFEEYIQQKMDVDRISMLDKGMRDTMDVRDKRIRIPFQSQIYSDFEQGKNKFNCQLFLQQIRDWLVDVIEITTSLSFNYYKKDELNLKQIKNYTCKNILLNIKEMFEKYDKLSLENRVELMKFVNLESREIFDSVMYKYPQNCGRNASKHVKSKIPKIDNRENDEFDFLRNNNINITYKQNGDYMEDIMKVINKLVAFSGQTFDMRDDLKQTNFEVFMDIMEYIFEDSPHQPVFKTLEGIVEIFNERSGLVQNIRGVKKFANFAFRLGQSLAMKQSLIMERKQTMMQRQLRNKDYVIGVKIPPGTRQFTEQQIQGCMFKSNDTSILRILTKWVEQLYNKLVNAEEVIYTRLYKFKDNKGKLVNLNLDLREEMYIAAREALKKSKSYIKYLRNQSIYLQTLFAGEKNIGKYSKLDTKIGTFAAKINEISSQYIFKHINKLIHCLLTIPRQAAKQRQSKTEATMLESINLVTLKIGDLLRCKHSCSQQQFLKIVQVLEELHMKNPEIMKVIRVKNRLDKKDNDILINIFWMNKIQCQLQLSIKGNINATEKKYGQFCHLIYEITRARLGPISEMSSIICQHDPLARIYSKQKSHGPQVKTQYLTRQRKKILFSKIKEQITLKKKLDIGNTTELPFICRTCRSLTVLSNPDFLYRQGTDIEIQCNECRYQQLRSQKPIQAYHHIINSSFPEKDSESRKFFVEHISYWNPENFINNLMKTEVSSQQAFQTLPTSGLLMTTHQKKPKLLLFSTVMDRDAGRFFFANVSDTGRQRIISSLTMKHEKIRQVQSMKQQLKKFIIFEFQGVRQIKENGQLKLQCFRTDCCHKEVIVGPFLQSEQILEISEKNYLMTQLQSQKSVLRMNLIKDAFRKLKQVIVRLQTKGRMFEKLLKSIQNIKAYKCSIEDTQILEKFTSLTELNISDNRQIKELKGINNCRFLRVLDVRNCNLTNLDDIKNNIRLKYINVSRNYNLSDIEGLKDHCHLTQLIINNTAIKDLSPLNTCPSLEILDIQNCYDIDSLNNLNTAKLSFLNTYGCIKLPQDPHLAIKKSILSKSHHLKMNRASSQIQEMSQSVMFQGLVTMARSFSFNPQKLGLQCVGKFFMTLMHDNNHPLPQQTKKSKGELLDPLTTIFY